MLLPHESGTGENGGRGAEPAQPEIVPGHRERQRKRVLKTGAYTLSDEQLLEMLLYYAVPRTDTKPLAKELLSRFGSIKGILDADGSALRKSRGIKDSGEVLFMLLRQVSLRDYGVRSRGNFGDPKVVAAHLFKIYDEIDFETVCAIYLDKEGGMLDSELVFRGTVNSAKFPMRAITEGVIRTRGAAVIIAHNHPSGRLIPSEDDIITTNTVAAQLAANGIDLIEHYIVGRGECMGIISKKIFKDK